MDSDHLLVGIWMRIKLKQLNKRRVVNSGRFDINKLEDQSINKEFRNKIKEFLLGREVVAITDVDGNWEQIKRAMTN